MRFIKYNFAFIFVITILKTIKPGWFFAALFLLVVGAQRVIAYPLPPPPPGNAPIYMAVTKTATICYEKMRKFPGKKEKFRLLGIIHKAFHSTYCAVGRGIIKGHMYVK
jgi:hypothetical protein